MMRDPNLGWAHRLGASHLPVQPRFSITSIIISSASDFQEPREVPPDLKVNIIKPKKDAIKSRSRGRQVCSERQQAR